MVARAFGGHLVSAPQPARRVALDVIMAVRESDAYANLLLPVRLGRAKLSDADAGLATELTYGTLRMQGYYDRIIAMAAGRDESWSRTNAVEFAHVQPLRHAGSGRD